MSYYKDPGELHRRALDNKYAKEKGTCICPPTGYSMDCTAHEGEDDHPAHDHKKHFPWVTTILLIFFFALLIFDTIYGGFNPLLFPGACE